MKPTEPLFVTVARCNKELVESEVAEQFLPLIDALMERTPELAEEQPSVETLALLRQLNDAVRDRTLAAWISHLEN